MSRILIFLVFASSTVTAQSKFLLGLNSGILSDSYFLSSNAGAYNRSLQGKLNWSIGVQSRFTLSERLLIDGQVGFNTKNFRADIISANNGSPDISFEGFDIDQKFLDASSSVCYLISPKSNAYFSLGLSYSIRLASNYSLNIPALWESDVPVESYKESFLGIRSAFGFLHPIGKSLLFGGEFYGKVYPFRVHSNFAINPFEIGLNFSVLRKFGRQPEPRK